MLENNCVGPVMEQLLDDLEKPDSVKRVAYHFTGGVAAPCERWNLISRLLVTLHGTYDARSDLQWRAAGRWLKDGAKKFHVVASEMAGTESEKVDGPYPTLMAWPVYRIQDTEGHPARYGVVEPLTIPSPAALAARWGVRVRCGVFDSNGHCGSPGAALDPRQAAIFFWELVHVARSKVDVLKNGDGVRQEKIQNLAAAILLSIYGAGCGDGAVYDYIYAASTGKDVTNACYLVMCAVDRLLKLILGRTHTQDQMKPMKISTVYTRCCQPPRYGQRG